jgi:hypothetical protein
MRELCRFLCNPRPALRAGAALLAGLLLTAAVSGAPADSRSPKQAEDFSFIVAGDMRSFAGPAPAVKRYFDGVCEALQSIGPGALMIGPGDCDPPGPVRAAVDRYLGTNYLWYPVFGNHELQNAKTMTWLRQCAEAGIPHQVRRGPPGAEDTTYSFDFGNSHFVGLNLYYDGRSDDVRKDDLPEAAVKWLEEDLKATHQPLIWVFGHTPIKALPDMDTHELRHPKESVSTNAVHLARFLGLLRDHHVRAYICGHTH